MPPSLLLVLILFSVIFNTTTQADDLDDFIRLQLQKRHVPGLSLAVIQNGKIVKAQAYGFLDKSGTNPVSTSTLFQAGSISKSVAAVGALRLVDEGKLSLDSDVNVTLRSWKVPDNEFTTDKKVTLRGLLSHTAGLTVHGFPGYEVGSPVPSVVQILDGEKPANTSPVRVDFVPGTRWRYSGGGYTVMQQLILDVVGGPFPKFMQETVLRPLRMAESTFEQPLPADLGTRTATGHYADRNLVKGRWHVYPEMAAAGLWTTPSDLARFAISIQHSFAGKPGGVLSQSMTRQMLTDQKNNDGLGVFLMGEGNTMRFGHNGRDEGFDALMIAGIETGQGVVIMINANDNSQMLGRIVDEVARTYNWSGYAAKTGTKRNGVAVNPKTLTAYEGRYEFSNNRMITFVADKNRLYTLVDGLFDEEFVPESDTRFASTDRDAYITFSPDAKGNVTEFVWTNEKEERKIARIGPLFRNMTAKPDPDPARTRQIETVLKSIAQRNKSLDDVVGLSAGAKHDFAGGVRELAGLKSITFIGLEDVKGRGIERHGSPVAQIRHYKLLNEKGQHWAIIHVTADGLVTDYDIVEQ